MLLDSNLWSYYHMFNTVGKLLNSRSYKFLTLLGTLVWFYDEKIRKIVQNSRFLEFCDISSTAYSSSLLSAYTFSSLFFTLQFCNLQFYMSTRLSRLRTKHACLSFSTTCRRNCFCSFLLLNLNSVSELSRTVEDKTIRATSPSQLSFE